MAIFKEITLLLKPLVMTNVGYGELFDDFSVKLGKIRAIRPYI